MYSKAFTLRSAVMLLIFTLSFAISFILQISSHIFFHFPSFHISLSLLHSLIFTLSLFVALSVIFLDAFHLLHRNLDHFPSAISYAVSRVGKTHWSGMREKCSMWSEYVIILFSRSFLLFFSFS